MMAVAKVSVGAVTDKARGIAEQAVRFAIPGFIVIVIIIYGFLALRINNLSNAQPSQSSIDNQTNPVATAHIDKNVIQQIEQLKDNNVNVQTLFEQARTNPFQD